MKPIPPPVTSSSSSHLQQQFDDEMYSILPRFEIPDVVLSSSALHHESESTSSIDKDEPSLKHAHKHDTDHDANITTKKIKRQHDHDCVQSDTSMKHVHVDNDTTMTNNSNSSATEIGSAFTSMTTATTAQDNANNTEELNIEMCSEVLGKEWLRRYDELIAFKQQHGHSNVPRNYALNKPLAHWVMTQRRYYKLLHQGKPSCMTAERQAALDKIGFEWGLDKNRFWQTRYNELIAFKQQHGHSNVPRIYPQNQSLAHWVMAQRTYYNSFRQGKPSYMTAERQAALEKIGFEWSFVDDSSWQARYNELIAFKQQHGHCNVPTRYKQNKPLGGWVGKQRTCYRFSRQGKPSPMTAERQAALEKIGFEWSLVRDT